MLLDICARVESGLAPIGNGNEGTERAKSGGRQKV